MVFNYGMKEVESFLISSAMFWVDRYHVDGLRVDAVASMLYLDYNRKDGEWEQNVNGGKENLEAIAFLQKLNTAILGRYPHKMMIAEESTAWPLVTKPASDGGLGFNFQVEHGLDERHAQLHEKPTRSSAPATTARSRSASSMRSVRTSCCPSATTRSSTAKCSLLNKMPGDYEEKFSNLRTFFGYMMAHPAKSCSLWARTSASLSSGTRRSRSTGCCSATISTVSCKATSGI